VSEACCAVLQKFMTLFIFYLRPPVKPVECVDLRTAGKKYNYCSALLIEYISHIYPTSMSYSQI
jgi:hypothetical protein